MTALEERNQKIIDAVLKKEKELCPGAVALVGIYGSFQTGDIHPLSDLDLLILINDERGWQLGTTFIEEDPGVGHDIYCTSWESLREDARYEEPHISKLMDAEIIYCADEKYREELEELRAGVRKILEAPFSEEDLEKAENALKQVQCLYAEAMTAEEFCEVRGYAGGVIYFAENALALLNKTYFRRGVRRRYEELNAMEKRPENLCGLIEGILTADTSDTLKERLTLFVHDLTACFHKEREALQPVKKTANADDLKGTYEEMFSNWHGKMQQAAETGDRHLAFMSLISFSQMLAGIGNELDIGTYDVMSVYDPEDLKRTAAGFDEILKAYLGEYQKAGLKPEQYADIDAFMQAYLSDEKMEVAECRR